MPIDFKELRELLAAIAQTDIAELNLKSEDFELAVRKSTPTISAATVVETTPVVVAPTVVPVQQPPVAPSPPPEVPAPPTVDKKWLEITSPMVGTFYCAPAPGEAAFVQVGDRIGLGQTVCIIEAMKLMNEIEAEVTGQVMEIVVENGEPVEYGQTLMWINPS